MQKQTANISGLILADAVPKAGLRIERVVCVCESVCVCERERECVRVTVWERGRESVFVCEKKDVFVC